MFVKNGLLDEFCKASTASKKLTGVPITWNSSKGRIEYHNGAFKMALIVTGFFFVASSTHLLKQKLGLVPTSNSEFNIGIMLAAVFGAVFHMVLTIYRNMSAENAIITGLVSFEKRHCANGTSKEDFKKLQTTRNAAKMLRLLSGSSCPITIAVCGSFLIPGLPMNVLSYSPGKEVLALFGYLLESGIPTWTWTRWLIVKLTLCVFNWYVWAVTFRFGIMFPSQIMLFSNTMSVCVSVFNRKFGTGSSLRGRHFHGQEDTWRKNFHIYREIQLLCGYFNQIHKFPLITMLITVVQGQVVSALGILKGDEGGAGTGADDDFSNLTTFKLFVNTYYLETVMMCAMVIDVLFGFCGHLFDTSKTCLDRLNHHQLLYQSKDCRRTLKSLTIIKILMGNDNYIEKMTPINYQQFTTDRIVDALLLSNPE